MEVSLTIYDLNEVSILLKSFLVPERNILCN
jgi:hypothetical protein